MLSSNSERWDIFAQKIRSENFKYDNQPERPSNSACKKKLAFGDLSNLPARLVNSDSNVSHKRKLSPSSQTDLFSKKQNTQAGVENKRLTIDVSEPKPGVPSVKRKATVHAKLQFSPTPKNSYVAILNSLEPMSDDEQISQTKFNKHPAKKPKYFTFSPEHIAQSLRAEYKKEVQECIKKTDALIEQFEPGYIQRKQAELSNLTYEQRQQMIAELTKKCEEWTYRDAETFTQMDLACTPRF